MEFYLLATKNQYINQGKENYNLRYTFHKITTQVVSNSNIVSAYEAIIRSAMKGGVEDS